MSKDFFKVQFTIMYRLWRGFDTFYDQNCQGVDPKSAQERMEGGGGAKTEIRYMFNKI